MIQDFEKFSIFLFMSLNRETADFHRQILGVDRVHPEFLVK